MARLISLLRCLGALVRTIRLPAKLTPAAGPVPPDTQLAPTGRPAWFLGGVQVLVLAALTVVGPLVFGPVTAAATDMPDAQTRVEVSTPETITAVGVSEHSSAGQGRGSPASHPSTGLATCIASDSGRVVARACQTNSSTGDTLVLMADGTKKPIKDVRLGDRVMATNPVTGKSGRRTVIDVIRHGGLHTMVAVRLTDGTTIDATDQHPFWVESLGAWVDAVELRPGDAVISTDGNALTVASVGISEQDLTAFNLTVGGLHTYHVSASEVLVHNAGCMSIGDALATRHGQQQLAARGFDDVDIAIARSSNLAYEQADGAMAHVAQLGDRYNVVVVGENGIVTGIKGLTERQMGNLARNHGWSGYP